MGIQLTDKRRFALSQQQQFTYRKKAEHTKALYSSFVVSFYRVILKNDYL